MGKIQSRRRYVYSNCCCFVIRPQIEINWIYLKKAFDPNLKDDKNVVSSRDFQKTAVFKLKSQTKIGQISGQKWTDLIFVTFSNFHFLNVPYFCLIHSGQFAMSPFHFFVSMSLFELYLCIKKLKWKNYVRSGNNYQLGPN